MTSQRPEDFVEEPEGKSWILCLGSACRDFSRNAGNLEVENVYLKNWKVERFREKKSAGLHRFRGAYIVKCRLQLGLSNGFRPATCVSPMCQGLTTFEQLGGELSRASQLCDCRNLWVQFAISTITKLVTTLCFEESQLCLSLAKRQVYTLDLQIHAYTNTLMYPCTQKLSLKMCIRCINSTPLVFHCFHSMLVNGKFCCIIVVYVSSWLHSFATHSTMFWFMFKTQTTFAIFRELTLGFRLNESLIQW